MRVSASQRKAASLGDAGHLRRPRGMLVELFQLVAPVQIMAIGRAGNLATIWVRTIGG